MAAKFFMECCLDNGKEEIIPTDFHVMLFDLCFDTTFMKKHLHLQCVVFYNSWRPGARISSLRNQGGMAKFLCDGLSEKGGSRISGSQGLKSLAGGREKMGLLIQMSRTPNIFDAFGVVGKTDCNSLWRFFRVDVDENANIC